MGSYKKAFVADFAGMYFQAGLPGCGGDVMVSQGIVQVPAVEQGRKLMWFGMLLFLLGLLTGFLPGIATNPRMALSSHLEGVMNGMLLVILGLVWPRLRLGSMLSRAGFNLALLGTFLNWGATLFAAFSGAGAGLMPIAGAGHSGTALAEGIVTASLVTLSAVMVMVSLIVLWGLRPAPDH